MSRTRGPARARATFLLLPILFLVALLTLITPVTAAAGDACSATQLCDSSAPCCSDTGVCGSGALFCAGGCNPLSSASPTSCQPNPVCVTQNISLTPQAYNNISFFQPILQYNGDANIAPFTLDSGSLGKGEEGVLMQMTSARQVKASTTRYIFYGDIEATLRHNASQGLVAAFILMSDVKDEIDWESTTSNSSDAQSNYFSLGIPKLGNGENVGPSTLDVSQWNTFGLNWQPNQLQWRINGQVVRTLTRSEAGTSYPRSPARVQLSVWAGGNATEPQGVQQWAGGVINYDSPEYTENGGFYAMEIKSLNIGCASQSAPGGNLTTVGANTSAPVTSWVYTGQNDTTGEPVVALSTDKITYLKDPGAGGWAGMPGWQDQNPGTSKSGLMWDGSGDNGVQDIATSNGSGSSSGGGGGVFTKAGAMKYGIPIAAAVVGLIVVWAMIMTCVRRKRKAERARQAAMLGGAAGGAAAAAGSLKAGSAHSAAGGSSGSGGYVTAGNVGRRGGGGGGGGAAKYAPLTDDWAADSQDDLLAGQESVEKRAAGGGASSYGSSYGHGYYDDGDTASYGRDVYPMRSTAPRGGGGYSDHVAFAPTPARSPAPSSVAPSSAGWATHRHQQQPYTPNYARVATPVAPTPPPQWGGYGGGWGQQQGQQQQQQQWGGGGNGGPGAGYYSYSTPGYGR